MTTLSIVIPVFNEVRTIATVLEHVARAPLPPGMGREIIVVDDGSRDGTGDAIAGYAGGYEGALQIITHPENWGKGAAVRSGFLAATGDMVVIQDADLEYSPSEYMRLLEPIVEYDADVVYGSRFITHEPHRILNFHHYVANKFLTFFSNVCTNLNLSDMETCHKMFTRQVVDEIKYALRSRRFGIEPELTARIKRYRVYEVGISYRGRTYAEGKKIRWTDAVSAFWSIIRFNFLAR